MKLTNEDRFNELYNANRIQLLNYFLRRTNDKEQAADCLAQTFLTAWRRIADIPLGNEGRLWLYGVARRVHGDTKRSSFRNARLVQRVASAMPSRVEHADGSDAEARLHSAIAALDEGDREIVLLNNWEELQPAEIAEILGMNVNTVKTRLHRARSKLKAELFSQVAADT